MTDRPRTVVKFSDNSPTNGKPTVAHITKEIRINGRPVLCESDSVYLEFEHGKATKVTVTLFPTEVHFNHDHPTPKV